MSRFDRNYAYLFKSKNFYTFDIQAMTEPTSQSDPRPFPKGFLELHMKLDRFCDELESLWKSGAQPSLLKLLLQAPSDWLPELLPQILPIDREYRLRAGLAADKLHYQKELAGLGECNLDVILNEEFTASEKRSSVQDMEATLDSKQDPSKAIFSPANASDPEINHLASGTDLPTGSRLRYFGDYEILGEIARGGMGVVYRAKQISLQRVIALKMVLAGKFADEDQIRRFRLEAEAAANLDHPGIVPIYDVGEYDGHHYFSMKLIVGKSLAQEQSKFRDPELAVALVAKTADAVHHAHQRGILHRDLKPANILIENDQPIVTDFGLARNLQADEQITQSGAVLGTPGYMSPEQALGNATTTATDIYSLGAILYSLLSGQPPHQRSSLIETLIAVRNEAPPSLRSLNASVAKDLELIVHKCLAKNAQDRYSSAAEMRLDLLAFLQGEPLRVRPPTIWELIRNWLSAHFGNVIWVPILAILFGFSVGILIWSGTIAQDNSQMMQQTNMYHFLGDEHRPWGAWIWQPPAALSLSLALLILCTMGWWTARLVKPRNRWADCAAGLSVGLASGLIAFVAGLGTCFFESFEARNEKDSFLLATMAAQGTSTQQERLLMVYPSLKDVSLYNQPLLIANKREIDRSMNHLWSSAIGAGFCLLWFGMIGVGETMVAGALFRQGSHWRNYITYFCYASALVGLVFIGNTYFVFKFIYGASSFLHPTMAFVSTIMLIGTLWGLNQSNRMAIRTSMACGSLILFGYFIFYDFILSAPPRLALNRAELAKAERSLQWYQRPEDSLRLAEANINLGDTLLDLSQYQQNLDYATYHHKGLRLLEEQPQLQESKLANRYRSNLYLFYASEADKRKSPAEALPYLQKSIEIGNVDLSGGLYSRTLAQLGNNEAMLKFIEDEYGKNKSLWKMGEHLRSAYSALVPNDQKTLIWQNETAKRWAKRLTSHARSSVSADEDQLLQWLLSYQTWKVFGPILDPGNTTPRNLLSRTLPIEREILDGTEGTGNSFELTCYPGEPNNLRESLGEAPYSVIYARLTFYLENPTRLTLRCGSDDGIRIWIDGEVVHEYAGHRITIRGNDTVPLNELAKGEHTMVIKIAQTRGDLGFVIDAMDGSGIPLALVSKQQSGNSK